VAARRNGRDPNPIEISLAAYQGQTIDITLTQIGADRRALVDWDRLELTPGPSAGQ
jgi:hypothetical protein